MPVNCGHVKEMKHSTIVFVLWILFLLAVLLAPISEPAIFVLGGFKHFDKIAHFGLFMITGYIIVFGARFFSRFRYRMFFGIVFGLCLAVGTEFAQYLIPARNMSLYDLFADVLGLSVGLALYTFFRCRHDVR